MTATIAAYTLSTVNDFVTSVLLYLRGGFIELNPLFSFFGTQYFFVYWVLSVGYPILLLEFGNRWAFLLLWVVTAVHLLCIVNNVMLGFA